jgi:hypothetical protein
MLTSIEYTNFRNGLAHLYPNLPTQPSYEDYVEYENLWEKYILNAATFLKTQPPIKRIGLIGMESAPGGAEHPHPNYIFHNTHNIIRPTGDDYLKNIFNGSHLIHGYYHNDKTKQECLDGLMNQTDFAETKRPIILFDLLPTHGISLSTPIRTFLGSGVITEINLEIQNKMNFILINLLTPLSLTWYDVHIKFACPPTTLILPSNIPTFIYNNTQGATIHPTSINTMGGGIAPNQNALRDNIIHHGF